MPEIIAVPKTRHRWLWLPAAAFAVLAVWIALDLAAAGPRDLRNFDAHEVGRLETDAWRAYYGHQPARLFGLMIQLLRRQYHLPFWQARVGAFYASRAAFRFQAGHQRTDYERALPDLERYYALIRRGSQDRFDVPQAARAELEWWIVHRERARHPPGDLVTALAELQACLYHQPARDFIEHAQARADAMLLRDDGAKLRGAPSEDDWRKIGDLLDRSWVSLRTAVASH